MKTSLISRLTIAACVALALSTVGGCGGNKDADTAATPATSAAKSTPASDTGAVKGNSGAGAKAPFDPSK